MSARSLLGPFVRVPLCASAVALACNAALTVALCVVVVELMRASMPPQPGAPEVDRDACTCSCWDGRFKQGHVAAGRYAVYKTLYFSFDERLAGIVAWSALCLALALEAVRAAFAAAVSGRCSRAALALLALQAYPFFYTFWACLNYLNEGSTRMLFTQLFFGASDLLVALVAAACADRRVRPHPGALWLIAGVSAVHVASNLSLLGANAAPRLGMTIMFYSDLLTLAGAAYALFCVASARAPQLILRLDALASRPSDAAAWLAAEAAAAAGEAGGDAGAAAGGSAAAAATEKPSFARLAGEADEGEGAGARGVLYDYTSAAFARDAAATGGLALLGTLYIRNQCMWSAELC